MSRFVGVVTFWSRVATRVSVVHAAPCRETFQNVHRPADTVPTRVEGFSSYSIPLPSCLCSIDAFMLTRILSINVSSALHDRADLWLSAPLHLQPRMINVCDFTWYIFRFYFVQAL
jgi:hypothetical protein